MAHGAAMGFGAGAGAAAGTIAVNSMFGSHNEHTSEEGGARSDGSGGGGGGGGGEWRQQKGCQNENRALISCLVSTSDLNNW